MEQLNNALTTRYEELEQQVKTLSKGNNFKESIKDLSEDYQAMLTTNNEMQKEMSQIG